MNRTKEIINLAYCLKKTLKTKDPFEIAKIYGIKVLLWDTTIEGFKAQILKMGSCPTLITINRKYDEIAQKVLCAHELGHAFLHEDVVNHFDVNDQRAHTMDVEYEANLFAVALLCEQADLNYPISKMDNRMLRSILDFNIQ